jgi:hypothetical protein
MSRRLIVSNALALLSAFAIAPLVHADDEGPSQLASNDPVSVLERWRKEAGMERHLALATLRGTLGLYERPAAPDWTPRTAGKGRLEVVHGVPVLRLEGTPEEMGEQAGKLVGREARALAECYLPAFIGSRKELEDARARAHRLFEPNMTESEKREIAAFARASGISPDDMLLAQGFTDLYRAWGCTTIGAVGESSDEPLLGRNLDFLDMGFVHRYSYVVVAKPEGKEPYVSVSWPGLVGVLSGMNRAGVSLAVMVVHDEHRCEPGVPFQLAFRRALEESKSTDDVTRKLRATKLTVTNNLMVVDKNGSADVLELAPDGVVARGPDARGRILSTNHFLSPERKESRVSLTYLSSRRRLAAAEKVCDAAPKITVPVAIEGLRASAGTAGLNVQSMVFQPRSGSLWVALAKPPAAKSDFVKLERADLLGD